MKTSFLQQYINSFIKFIVPKGSGVLVLSENNYHQELTKIQKQQRTYDYVIANDIFKNELDILSLLEKISLFLKPEGRLIVIYKNFLHSFIKGFFQSFLEVSKQENWLSTDDLINFLQLSQFEPITRQPVLLTTYEVPLLTPLLNRLLLFLFPFNHLANLYYIVARKRPTVIYDLTTSIIIPARNEAGNIARLFQSLPVLGSRSEIIFVEGHSRDQTRQEILNHIVTNKHALPFEFKFIDQGAGRGKADAVRRGFAEASGDILMILDADMSVKPHDLTKFYLAIISGTGEFINGSRLVYPMQGKAMQFLNILGNKFFSLLYSWILGQSVKDTLCGTKVLYRKHYLQVQKDPLFGKYDPFGDFDLLLGASKLHLKIVDLPVRYYERNYGATNIKRFQNGWELLKYSLIAIKHLKMRLI